MGSDWSSPKPTSSDAHRRRSTVPRKDLDAHRKNTPSKLNSTTDARKARKAGRSRNDGQDAHSRATGSKRRRHRKKSTQGSDVPDDELQLCDECRQFNWSRFARTETPSKLTDHGRLIVIKGTREQLTTSPCRICKFLGQFIATEGQKARVRLSLAQLGSHLAPRARDDQLSEKDNTTLEVGGLLGGGLARVHRKEFGVLYAHHDLYPRRTFMAPRIVPPKIDFTPLSKWLDFCDAKHVKECTVSRRVRLPGFKVIDCHTNQIVSQDAVDCRYVALSYVWGEPGASSDGDSMFPATIADSITVCVALGFRYLWVDRYCINQGNAAEKHVQIHLMDRIYMQAELTIFAAAGSGSDDGLPGVSTMIRTPQQRLKIGDMELVEILNSVDRVSMSTWASRAWTYQEGSMSKRRLIFTDQEVVFLCSRMYCQESIQQELTRSPGLWDGLDSYEFRNVIPRVFDNPHRYGHKDIQGILTEYSSRSISYDTDALNACRGILKAMHTIHCWGAPVETIPKSQHFAMNLFWQNNQPGRRRDMFPSWSWASHSGPKTFRPLGTASNACEVQVQLDAGGWQAIDDYMQTHNGTNEIAVSRTLRILGQTFKPSFVDQTWRDRNVPSLKGDRHTGFYAKFPCSADTFSLYEVYLDEEHFDARTLADAVALLIEGGQKSHMAQVFLILRPSGDAYRRVGITNWLGVDFDYSHGIVSPADKPATPIWMERLEERVVYLE